MSGAQVYFTASMASGASATSEIDLGHSWHQVWVSIPSMASGSDVYFLGTTQSGGTYKRMYHAPTIGVATSTPIYVTSGVTNCIVAMPNLHMRYIKVQLSTATTDTPYTFQVICSGEQT